LVRALKKKNWIKDLRLKKGLTQKSAAALMSVNIRTWRRWELNFASIPEKTEKAIKNIVGE
jgi:transcriptional regulator with XRE-family HTH domain